MATIPPTAVITSLAPANGVCLAVGAMSASASTSNNGGGTLSYNWQINSDPNIPSGTSVRGTASFAASFDTLFAVAGAGTKYLWLTTTNVAGSASSKVTVYLIAFPTASIVDASYTTSGENITLNGSGTATSPATITNYSFIWDSTTNIANGSNPSPTIGYGSFFNIIKRNGVGYVQIVTTDSYGQTSPRSDSTPVTLTAPFVLAVGGGGGGGGGWKNTYADGGGGGGGGGGDATWGYIGQHSTTIGTGGAGSSLGNAPNNGTYTQWGGDQAIWAGGGGGGSATSIAPGAGTSSSAGGGAPGGGGGPVVAGGVGSDPGAAGGASVIAGLRGGGGGAYGTVGTNGTNGTGARSATGTYPNPIITAAITGTVIYYGSGGGGGSTTTAAGGVGGNGGLAGGNGGYGGTSATVGSDAPSGTLITSCYGCGGGGGGVNGATTYRAGGKGSDGCIIIRYDDSKYVISGRGSKVVTGANSLWLITTASSGTTVTIATTAPVITTTGPYYINGQTTINAGCTATPYSPNTISSYAWTMNGYTLASIPNPKFSYNDFSAAGAYAGSNILTINVTDNLGQVGTITTTVTLTGVYGGVPGPADINVAGTARPVYSSAYTVRGGTIVGFNARVLINWATAWRTVGTVIFGINAITLSNLIVSCMAAGKTTLSGTANCEYNTSTLVTTANAGGPYFVTSGYNVTLDGSGSTGPELTYDWILNYITVATGVNPSVPYETLFNAAGSIGKKTLSLIVTDNNNVIHMNNTTITLSVSRSVNSSRIVKYYFEDGTIAYWHWEPT